MKRADLGFESDATHSRRAPSGNARSAIGAAAIAAIVVLAGCTAPTDPAAPAQNDPSGSSQEAWWASGSPFTPFYPHGGWGGNASELHCPAHEVLVGINGRAGTVVDGVSLICGILSSNGTITGYDWRNEYVGGSGGNQQYGYCPANSWVTNVAFYYSNLIDSIYIWCSDASGRNTSNGWMRAVGTTYGQYGAADNCGQYGASYGIYGFNTRSGTFVDNLQTECEYLNP